MPFLEYLFRCVALSLFPLLRLLLHRVLMLVLLLCEAAAAPQSLAICRRQQLQKLAASRTESLAHFRSVLEAAATRCNKLMAAKEAFKEV